MEESINQDLAKQKLQKQTGEDTELMMNLNFQKEEDSSNHSSQCESFVMRGKRNS